MSKHHFKTEAELCAAYITHAQRDSEWTAYPETAGWDILLVRNADGFQIGIQAKMSFNMKVLAQAIEGTCGSWSDDGPDCRAVLVPTAPDGANAVCTALGLSLIRFTGRSGYFDGGLQFHPNLPGGRRGGDHYPYGSNWPEWSPDKRHPLPAYVPDVVAGSAAPIQLTKWKISALKVVAMLQLRGYVTRADFKAIGIDARRWIAPGAGFLDADDAGRFIASKRLPDFEAQHPVVFPQVMAETAAQLGGGA